MNDLQEDKATKRRSSTSPGRTFSAALGALVLLLMLTGQAAPAKAGETLIDGLAWRALTDTAGAGLSWSDVATVCPLNETPCKGSVNGIDFTGWTWASKSRVEAMLYQLTGWSIGDSGPYYGSTLDLFFDQFAPVKETDGVKLSHAIYALPEIPGDAMVGAIWIIDAKVPAGTDAIDEQPIDVTATEAGGTFFGGQPIGVFLVRDPALEICNNGIDDNGDGLADIDDETCTALNPVINGREWRQLTVTQGMAFWDVAAVCPAGGLPCSGSVGNVNFDGWIWANSVEVYYMFQALTGYGAFESIPADPTVVPKVFDKFSPTASLATADILFGNTYDSIRSESPSRSGDFWYAFSAINNGVEDFGDPLTCRNGLDDNLNGSVDFADPACYSSRMFSVVDYFDDDPLEDFITTAPGPNIGDTYTPNPFHGYFLSREPLLASRESCDNTFDDDGDGLIDAEDPDCELIDGFQDVKVRCIHEPLYPQSDESVTLRASTINGEGEEINVQAVEIYQEFIFQENVTSPVVVAEGASEVTYTFTPTGAQFAYGCRAVNEWETATSWRVNEELLRTVDVGELELPDIAAIPVAISGYRDRRIDVVFFADDDEYPSPTDPAFQADVYRLIYEGFFTIPWFVEHQWMFNFWIGSADTGNASPNPDDLDEFENERCFKTKPANFDEDYSWAEVAALVHTSNCRDGAKDGAFSIEMDARRLQVVAHEAGHTPFGMSDEYRLKPKGYYEPNERPNVFATEEECRDQAVTRTYEADDCRWLATDENGEDWWLPEPDYRSETDRTLQTKDLMQQTGATDTPDGTRLDRYKVGNSEKDRMGWFWTRCVGGAC